MNVLRGALLAQLVAHVSCDGDADFVAPIHHEARLKAQAPVGVKGGVIAHGDVDGGEQGEAKPGEVLAINRHAQLWHDARIGDRHGLDRLAREVHIQLAQVIACLVDHHRQHKAELGELEQANAPPELGLDLVSDVDGFFALIGAADEPQR